MISLRWSDINVRAGRLTVAKATYERTVEDRHEDETKGGKEKPVPMSPRLVKALKRLRPLNKREHVLVNKDGKPLSWRELTGVVMRAERDCGMPARQGLLHVLRHTYVSHLALAGVPAITIQAMARHEHLMTTQKYMHLSKDAKEDAMKALAKLRAG
jgi:integrase